MSYKASAGSLFLVLFLTGMFPGRTDASPLGWVADDFEVLMRTHGQVTFAPYVHGGSPADGSTPGYRSDF